MLIGDGGHRRDVPARPVPYYAQTADFSCGAAALVMALHALRGTPVTRSFEFDVWRDGTTIGTLGMDQWGLAAAAALRGVRATVVAERERTFGEPSKVARERFTKQQLEIAWFVAGENRRRAREAGVAWQHRAPTHDDLVHALAQGQVPVLLVDLWTLGRQYEAPHWVVVVDADEQDAVLHDPDPDGPGVRTVTPGALQEAADVSRYNADRALVLLGP